MKRLTKGLLSALLAVAFLSRGAAAFCAPAAGAHDCCDASAPAAPSTPCAEMACCQVLPPAAPAVAPAFDSVALPQAAPAVRLTTETSFAFRAPDDGGPPGPAVGSFSGLSPPAPRG